MARIANACIVAPAALGMALLASPGASAAVRPTIGIWISPQEILALPMSGPAWASLKAAADKPLGVPDVSNQDDNTDVYVLAKALVYVRSGIPSYRDEVVLACRAAIGTEAGGRTLALGRNLIGYVLAADLVILPEDVDEQFSAWLATCLTERLESKTLISTHEDRPNNWGTHAGASRMAVARYLRDDAALARAAAVFKGWLGDRSAYAGFTYGDLAWQADPAKPVGINPKGATKSGRDIDGVLPDDQRRGGGFVWPPPKEKYVYEALQGAIAQAVILQRAGHDPFSWQDEALRRSYQWLHAVCLYGATGDDTWQPHVINHFYGTSFPAPVPAQPGKNVGWTDWTHAGSALAPTPTDPEPPPPALPAPTPPSDPAPAPAPAPASASAPDPSPAPEPPTEAPVAPQVVTIGPSDDGHVSSGGPNKCYGTIGTMRVRAGSPAYNTYLKFNVTGLSGTVQNATLRLFVTDGGDRGGAVYQASGSYRNTSTPWGQGGLTWNNAPALMGTPLASAGPVASNTWIELDVTAAIGGNGTCSLGLTTASSNSVYFCTKEGSNPPQLVITFVPSEVTSAGSDD